MSGPSTLSRAFWLVLCVFLLYQQSAEMALTLTVPVARDIGYDDPSTPHCEDWEVFDGTDCVCASTGQDQCTDEGGMICDDKGGHYKSACVFALEMCNQNISVERTVQSCGYCNILTLSGGKGNPKDQILAKFQRKGPEAGLATRYLSVAGDGAEVFFVPSVGSWAVGHTNTTDDYIGMVQLVHNVSHPQDGNPGMLVPTLNGTQIAWEFDESYSLVCSDDTSPTSVHQKRFIFLIIGIVTAVTAATATTLHVVQAVKGCLYYPNVCTMRDEIKDHLLPDLQRDEQKFLSTYGQPSQFTTVVDKIHDQIMEIRDKIIEIPTLHTSLNTSLASLVSTYSSAKDFAEISSALKDYNDWEAGIMQSAAISVALLPVDILTALPSMLITSASALAIAGAAIGVVLAFAFAIVDVVSSVLEEKKVRDQLSKKKNTLLDARRKLDNAFNKMHEFQLDFCQYVVKFLYDFSLKGAPYDQSFSSLNNFIKSKYSKTSNRCTYSYIVGRSKKDTLVSIGNTYLPKIVSVLTNNVNKLKLHIAEVKETQAFLGIIRTRVRNNEHPEDIFRFIKANKPQLTNSMFKNVFGLLKFIAKSIYSNNNCYWGFGLDTIRRGTSTEQNYLQEPICYSNLFLDLDTTIVNAVRAEEPVCQIYNKVKGKVFHNTYQVIRFIADYKKRNDACYWGYDLASIRSTAHATAELNSAKLDSTLQSTLVNLDAGGQIAIAKQIMRSAGISSNAWKTFVLCQLWKNQTARTSLHCPSSFTAGTCFPGLDTFVKCETSDPQIVG